MKWLVLRETNELVRKARIVDILDEEVDAPGVGFWGIHDQKIAKSAGLIDGQIENHPSQSRVP